MTKNPNSFALREALLGHHGPLIARIMKGATLTPDERDYIADMLQGLDGKRGKAALKHVGEDRVAEHVESLARKSGSTKAAVAEVEKQTGRKRSSIFADMRESKKRD